LRFVLKVTAAGGIFVMERSAEAPTVAELDALLLPELLSVVVDDETVAVFVMVVPFATLAPTL
jgi:hypothetical protein